MALMNLVYRDQLFPREAYRLTFERLREQLSQRAACKIGGTARAWPTSAPVKRSWPDAARRALPPDQLPDLGALRSRFAPDPARLPRGVRRSSPR